MMRSTMIVLLFCASSAIATLAFGAGKESCAEGWAMLDASDYHFFITQSGRHSSGSGMRMDGTFRVTVHNGSVTKAVAVHQLREAAAPARGLPGTIDDIFRIIDEAHANERETVVFLCHPILSYPTYVEIRQRAVWPETWVEWSILLVEEPEPINLKPSKPDQRN